MVVCPRESLGGALGDSLTDTACVRSASRDHLATDEHAGATRYRRGGVGGHL